MNQNLELDNINKNLKRGDASRIAQKTGFSTNYIRKVLRGKRESQEVIKVAAAIAITNEKDDEQLNKLLNILAR